MIRVSKVDLRELRKTASAYKLSVSAYIRSRIGAA